MSEHFPKQKSLGGNEKIELDLFNYVTNEDLKTKQLLIHLNLLKKLI